jgi:2-(1,2-epoxy-1,2-dihydrophenyl)acetyl-CoA isomerase
MSDSLLIERTDALITITLNRPDRLNAFRRSEYLRLQELLGTINGDPSVRAAVITGAGRGFCAGEDLKELAAAGADPNAALTTENVAILQDITRRMLRSHCIFIAAVNGVAAGFGAELAVACDIRIGCAATRFVFPEVRRGLFITNGVSHLLPQIVGATWANMLLLTGREIDARTSERIGLITEIVTGDSLLLSAQLLAESIAANAPTAVRLTKRILRDEDEAALERALATEVAYTTECLNSGEQIEGARAFVEKRAPQFDA